MKEGYIKKENRKKILLLTDDIRVHSGVAQIGREMVINTCHRYNWCQMAGAVKHPDKGKVLDLSKEIGEHAKVKDPYVMSYPVDGYGNADLLNQIINREKPDALFGISKQSHNINKLVLGNRGKNKLFKYVPHGLNNKIFKPLDEDNAQLLNFKTKLTGGVDYDFITLFNSRNIRRKNISDLIVAWKLFNEKLTKEESKKCLLVLHTEPTFEAGTDLPAVIDYFCPSDGTCNVVLSPTRFSSKDMN